MLWFYLFCVLESNFVLFETYIYAVIVLFKFG